MTDSTPSSSAAADELLYGFDIADDPDSRDFLRSLVASGRAPRAELLELRRLSLMRGVEEWDMLLACASALREKRWRCCDHGDDEMGATTTTTTTSLVPFVGALLTGRAAAGCRSQSRSWSYGRLLGGNEGGENAGRGRGRGRAKGKRVLGVPKRKGSVKEVSSPFWGDAGKSSGEKTGRMQRPVGASVPATACGQEAVQDVQMDAVEPSGGEGAMVDCDPMDGVQATTQIGLERDAEATAPQDGVSAAPMPDVQGTLTSPDGDFCSSIKPCPVAERAAKAARGSKSPFFSPSTPAREKQARTNPAAALSGSKKKKARPPRGTVSSLPFPPLSADRFGLIQEELADDPFRLLIAVTFLIRTAGRAAIPVFRQLMQRFPTPDALAAADPADIVPLIRPLGLSAVRCAAIQRYARAWRESPPSRLVRYAVKNYPRPGDGRHVRAGEVFGPEDDDGGFGAGAVDAAADARERALGCAWEIGHLTQGPYALDSWRIFCRDVLLGRSTHWTGRDGAPGFQPEWMRVLPGDKALRACLRWLW